MSGLRGPRGSGPVPEKDGLSAPAPSGSEGALPLAAQLLTTGSPRPDSSRTDAQLVEEGGDERMLTLTPSRPAALLPWRRVPHGEQPGLGPVGHHGGGRGGAVLRDAAGGRGPAETQWHGPQRPQGQWPRRVLPAAPGSPSVWIGFLLTTGFASGNFRPSFWSVLSARKSGRRRLGEPVWHAPGAPGPTLHTPHPALSVRPQSITAREQGCPESELGTGPGGAGGTARD